MSGVIKAGDFSAIEGRTCSKCDFKVKERQYLGAHEDSLHCKARVESREQTKAGYRATMIDRQPHLWEAGIFYIRGHSVRRGREICIEVLWVPAAVEMLCRIGDPNELRWALGKWAHDEGFRQIFETILDVGKSIHKTAAVLAQVHSMWKRERADWKAAQDAMEAKKSKTPTEDQVAGFRQRDRMRTLARMLRVPTEGRTVEDVHADMVASLTELQLHYEALKGAAAAAVKAKTDTGIATALNSLSDVLDEVLT